MLNLGEELLLLYLDVNGGKLPAAACPFTLALSGALIGELSLQGHIVIDQGLVLPNRDQPAHPLLADALRELRRFPVPRPVGEWLQPLVSSLDLPHSLALSLSRSGSLRLQRKTVLHLFTLDRYPVSRPEFRQNLRAVLLGHTTADPRVRSLFCLSHASGLLSHLFTKEEWSTAKSAADSMISSDPIATEVEAAIRRSETEAAVLLMVTSG